MSSSDCEVGGSDYMGGVSDLEGDGVDMVPCAFRRSTTLRVY